jgi:hypothetical protein
MGWIPCRWHDEQCTLAEFSAFIVRDVMAHVDLAAEARVIKSLRSQQLHDDAESSDDEDVKRRTIPAVELVDIGGGDNDTMDADIEDVPIGEVSSFPLRDVMATIAIAMLQGDLASLDSKRRKSKADLDSKALDDACAPHLQEDFGMASGATQLPRSSMIAHDPGIAHGFPKDHSSMIALQKQTVALAKKLGRVLRLKISFCTTESLFLYEHPVRGFWLRAPSRQFWTISKRLRGLKQDSWNIPG